MRKTATAEKRTQQNSSTTRAHKIMTVVGTVLCIILTPILIANITLIIRSYTQPDKVPGIGGMTPMCVNL